MALKVFQGIGAGEAGRGVEEGENHKRETDRCFRPFSSLPSFHHSLAANGGEDGDERRKEERRKGHLLSLLSLLSSSSNQEAPVTRYSGKLKCKVHFFPVMSSTGSTGVIVVLLGQTSSRFSLCCFVHVYKFVSPSIKTSLNLRDSTFARFWPIIVSIM